MQSTLRNYIVAQSKEVVQVTSLESTEQMLEYLTFFKDLQNMNHIDSGETQETNKWWGGKR